MPLKIWPTLALLIEDCKSCCQGSHICYQIFIHRRDAPLEMLEGLLSNDILCLDELGVENCYDLVSIDFISLILETPYSARQVVDWILQAKLCTYFGESIADLRKYGIQHITQLAAISDEVKFQAM